MNLTSINNYLKIFANKRLLVTLLMGFSSGLPLALCSSTLQAWFTVSGISIITIGALTLVQQPYAFKWLWAPFLDRYVPPFLGRRRGWILLMQISLVIALATMAYLNPHVSPGLLGMLGFIVAFLSATQDIGIDAYRTDLLKPEERGMGAAMVTAGYRAAIIISGGGAMMVAAKVGWRITYLSMAAIMALEILITLWSPEPEQVATSPITLLKAVVDPFKEFLARDSAIAILIFIVIYKLTDAFTLSLGTPFLIRGMGFSLLEVGAIYKGVGMAATIIGAFLAGALMPRLGLYRSLLYFGILQGASNLMFMALAIVGKNFSLMVSAIFTESFCSGLGTVALVAFLMSLCDLRYTATQFALLSAVASIGRVFVGPIAGIAVKYIGWAEFYFWATMLAIPGLLLLWWLRQQTMTSMNVASVSPENKAS